MGAYQGTLPRNRTRSGRPYQRILLGGLPGSSPGELTSFLYVCLQVLAQRGLRLHCFLYSFCRFYGGAYLEGLPAELTSVAYQGDLTRAPYHGTSTGDLNKGVYQRTLPREPYQGTLPEDRSVGFIWVFAERLRFQYSS